jgi:DNA-binding XRE family transcriptional regulator
MLNFSNNLNMSDVNVKELREKLDISQKDFAKKIGVHRRTIQNWENGGVIPGVKSTLLCNIELEINEKMKERLTEFLAYLGIEQTKFEEKIGLSGLISKINNGGISPNIVDKISEKYPELNTGWLKTGDGEMLKQNYQKIGDVSHSTVVGSNVYGISEELISKYSENYQEIIKMQQQQIGELILIISKLTDKQV